MLLLERVNHFTNKKSFLILDVVSVKSRADLLGANSLKWSRQNAQFKEQRAPLAGAQVHLSICNHNIKQLLPF